MSQRKLLFRYQPNWSTYQDVQRIVRHNWQGHGTGVPMFRFLRKLRSIKNELKSWKKAKFTHFRHQVDKNTTQLQIVESKLITDPQSPRLNAWHLRLLKQREQLLLFNKRYWGTLARKKWLVDGDRATRYFHQSAQKKKHKCSILRIKDPSGIWIEEPHAVRQRFIQDYIHQFSSARASLTTLNGHLADPVITAEENEALIKPVTDEEIHTAVFQMEIWGVFLSRSLECY